MKHIRILMKIRLQALLSSLLYSSKGGTRHRRSTGVTVALIALFGFALLSMLMLTASLSAGIAMLAFETYNIPWFYYTFLSLLSFLLMVLTGMFAAKSQLYEAKDNELLLAMPLRPRHILLARMLTLYLSDLLFDLMVMLPAGVVALLFAPVKPLGVIFYLLGILLLPLPALAVSALLGWIIAWVESRCRNKTLPRTILAMLFFFVYLYGCMRADTIFEGIAQNAQAIAGALRSWAYPFYLFGLACADGTVWAFLLYAAVCLVPLGVCVWLLGRSFLSIVTTKRTAKKIVYDAARENRAAASPLMALVRKEIGYFFGCFTYLLNAGIGVVMTLLLGVLVLVNQGKLHEMLALMSEEMGIALTGDHAALVMVALSFFVASMTDISAPSVSLEGSKLWIPLTFPLRGKTILLAKTLAHVTVTALPTLLFSVMAIIATRPSVPMALLLLLLPQVFNLAVALTGTLFGVRFPKLDWIDETIAVKQSMSVLFTMLVVFVGGLLLCVGGFMLCLVLSPVPAGVVVLAVLCGITFLLFEIEEHGGGRAFEALGNR